MCGSLNKLISIQKNADSAWACLGKIDGVVLIT